MDTTKLTIKFPPDDDDFFSDLRSEVRAYFKSTNQNIYGNAFMYAKAFGLAAIYIAGYALPLIFDLSATSIVLIYGFLGIWSVFLGVNVGHDAAHHALFQNSEIQRLGNAYFRFAWLEFIQLEKPTCLGSSCVFQHHEL
jgi:linoleoyl-CoA desaturase